MRSFILPLAIISAIGPTALGQAPESAIEKSLEKGVAYLVAETPKWRTEHKCASCHHQGSAMRALLAARGKGWLKDDEPLKNTLEWLEQPAKWADNHGDPMASDQALAELQFGASLHRAQKSFPDRMKIPLSTLAKMLAARQDKDGKVSLTNSEGLASPITMGPILLTGEAKRVFECQGEDYQAQARKANQWLENVVPRNTFEASSLLLAISAEQRNKQPCAQARELLIKSAHEDGGFGPYLSSPAEVFDTALAILALSRDKEATKNRGLIERAQLKLAAWQQTDGSWEETTRPSGSVSYAHRVSTTAWAVEALLENSRPK